MHLSELQSIYNTSGPIGARLSIDSVDCELIDILMTMPELTTYKQYTGYEWCWLLRTQPKYWIYCDWSCLNGYDWRWLLCVQPEFHVYCDWDKLSSSNLCELLAEQAQLHQYGDCTKLSENQWYYLLEYQPQLITYKPSRL